MPYGLRPNNKRKCPVRYQGDSDDELDNILDLDNRNQATHSGFSGHCSDQLSSPGSRRPSIQSLSTFTPHSAGQRPPSTHTLPAPLHPSRSRHTSSRIGTRRTMPNVRYVRKKEPHPHIAVRHDNHDNEVVSVHRPTARAVNCPNRPAPATATATFYYPGIKPAAFPSLPMDRLPPKDALPDIEQHGVRSLMAAMETRNQSLIEERQQIVDCMYNKGTFPTYVHDRQRSWYTDLRNRWAIDESSVEVGALLCCRKLHQNDGFRSLSSLSGRRFVRLSSSKSAMTFPQGPTANLIIQ